MVENKETYVKKFKDVPFADLEIHNNGIIFRTSKSIFASWSNMYKNLGDTKESSATFDIDDRFPVDIVDYFLCQMPFQSIDEFDSFNILILELENMFDVCDKQILRNNLILVIDALKDLKREEKKLSEINITRLVRIFDMYKTYDHQFITTFINELIDKKLLSPEMQRKIPPIYLSNYISGILPFEGGYWTYVSLEKNKHKRKRDNPA